MVEISENSLKPAINFWLQPRVNADAASESGDFESWLRNLTEQEILWVAARSTARCLPFVLGKLHGNNFDAPGWGSALSAFREVFIPLVLGTQPHLKNLIHVGHSHMSANVTFNLIGGEVTYSFANSNVDLQDASIGAIRMSIRAPARKYELDDLLNPFIEGLERDCICLLSGSNRASQKLWTEVPRDVILLWSSLFGVGEGLGPLEQKNWSFWANWYDNLLKGNPLNWPMLEQIALTDVEIWDAGPGAVAERIADVEKRALVDEVKRLKGDVRLALSQLEEKPLRGHNNPPSLVEDAATGLTQSITVIWETLSDVEKELEKEKPDPNRLKALADWLTAVLKKAGGYCASLADISLKKGAEVLGEAGTKWAIRGGVAYFAAQNEQVQNLATWLGRFAEILAR